MTKADAVQIELMRRAGPKARAALALRLSDETLALSRRAIDRSFPELDEDARRLKYVEIQYGRELASRLSRWLVAHGKRLG